MEIIKTEDFVKTFEKLPKEIRRLYLVQENRFAINWHDARLHIKKIRSLLFALSFRITRRYRVFFYFRDSNAAIFFAIDHRKDIYK